MTVALTANELKFKNKALTTATNAIIKARNNAVSSYLTIGEKLLEIRDSKLYKDDFTTFEDFTLEVFGLSKSTAYRMISVTTRFLIPEKSANAEKFFTDFEDTALGALLSVPMTEGEMTDTYTATKEFCEEHYIDTTTPVAEIRKIIKDAKKEVECLNVETEENTEETVDTEPELPISENGNILTLTDVQRDSVMNTINSLTAFISKVTEDVTNNGTITEVDFKTLSTMYKAIGRV